VGQGFLIAANYFFFLSRRRLPKSHTTDQAHALGDRIREVASAIGTNALAAEVAGVTPQQLHNYTTAKNAPSLLPVAKMAAHAGFRLEWVVFGEGEKRARADAAQTPLEAAMLRVETALDAAAKVRPALEASARIFDLADVIYAQLLRVYNARIGKMVPASALRLASMTFVAIIFGARGGDTSEELAELAADAYGHLLDAASGAAEPEAGTRQRGRRKTP
jgi:hypothetical protein